MSNDNKQKQAFSFLVKASVFKILSLLGGTGLLIIIGILFFVVIIASIINADFGGTGGISEGTKDLPEHVEEVRPLVEAEAQDQDIGEYTDVILALIAQESGGNPEVVDIMQSSESMCDGQTGCITSTEESISYGVSYFKEVLEQADNDIRLALQSYNFGIGFIDYAQENNNGNYSEEIAIEFSQMMFEDSGRDFDTYSCPRAGSRELDACYGDIKYVEAVTDYYKPISSDPLEDIPSNVAFAGEISDIDISEDMNISRGTGNTYLEGHCTFFAYEIREMMGKPVPNSWGDADTWDDRAEENEEFEVSDNPEVGAVYQLDRGGRDCCYEYGHVGIVTEVFENGDFIVVEMNWNGGPGSITERKLSNHPDDNFIL